MNNAFRWIYNTLRATIMIVVLLLVVAYAALYLGVSMPYFQNKLKAVAEREASKFLETDVTIDGVNISPFNQVVLTGVKIPDQSGGDLIKVDKVGAGISLYDLIVKGKLIFNFAEIDGLHGTVTRPDKNRPSNLQFIIDKFKPKPNQPPKPYDIRINNAILRNCDIAYDVLNDPAKRKKSEQYGQQWRQADAFGGAGGQGFGGFGGQAGGSPFEGFDFSNFTGGGGFSSFFENLFGGGGRGHSSGFSGFGGFGGQQAPQESQATVTIDMYTALLGGEVIVGLSGGQKLKLKIKPGTQPGSKVRLRGKGAGGNDLILTYQVTLPANLSERQRQLVEEMRHS